VRVSGRRVVAASLVALALGACSGQVEKGAPEVSDGSVPLAGAGGSGAQAACTPVRELFAERVWSPVFDRICLNCHSPDGVATAQNAMLSLLPSQYPGFLDANFDNVSYVARFEFDGRSILLRKPLGEMDHGGGAVLQEDSEQYAALEELVAALQADDGCNTAPAPPNFDDLELLDPPGTLRKATIQLAGRLPTQAELDRLGAEGEAALPALLDAVLNEEAFLARLRDIYNDELLTDYYLRYNGAAIGLLDEQDFPYVGPAYDMLDETLRAKINRALAREPLELITHVVKLDRPFSEILTADYAVVNPFSAQAYGVSPAFSDPEDEREWVEVSISVPRDGGLAGIPHAGILTTPVFLNRFPTTPTNRSRHRARKLFDMFLATDILRVASRPIDPEASSRYNNPTRDDPQCTGCHRQIDPVAGAFLQWNERDQEQLETAPEWHPEMFPPGFGKAVMDTTDYGSALRWLADKLVADPRFVLATVHTIYRGISGREPLAFPEDPDAPDFDARRRAWSAQDAVFRAAADAFVADDMNLKTLVRQLVLSPYFRAANASGELTEARALELRDVGGGRLSIPSVLANKIEAVTGLRWDRDWDHQDYLTTDYRILYGDIDSDAVTERLTTPNGIMANVALRMANEVACDIVGNDFNRSAATRTLFPRVEATDVPETPTGDAVPAAVTRIQDNIAYLHERVLGEHLPPGDPELARTYQLFVETFREGSAAVRAETQGKQLPWRCSGRIDLATGADLPDEQQLHQDESYSIRAWMAVVTYLLADYGFLHE